jgi:hypothetical protein
VEKMEYTEASQLVLPAIYIIRTTGQRKKGMGGVRSTHGVETCAQSFN